MKRTLLAIIILILFSENSMAQYRENKRLYDPRTYTYHSEDPHSVISAGISSFFIPGLGQIISEEPGRGVIFLGTYTATMVFAISFTFNAIERARNDLGDPLFPLFREFSMAAYGLLVFSFVAIPAIIIDIWSVVDAVRVTKVNNLAWRASNSPGVSLNLKPYIGTNSINNSAIAGVSFNVKF